MLEGNVEAGRRVGKDQYGFTNNRGTEDASGLLRVLRERCLEMNSDLLYIYFYWLQKGQS